MRRAILPLFFMAAACGGVETEDVGAGMVGDIDTSAGGIAAYVRAQRHAGSGWTAEPAVHDSRGPHGKVRTFFNDALVASLQADAASHPKGSASIKELYKSDGTTLDGYAVMVKVEDGTDKMTWLWWEGFTPDLGSAVYAKGASGCDGCHSSGKDKVVSALP